MTATKRGVSMLAMYKREVFPLLAEHGFTGTVAKSERSLARGRCWAHAKGKDGELHVRIEGYFNAGEAMRVPFEERLDVRAKDRDAAVRALRDRLRALLEEISAKDRADAAVPQPRSLGEALSALLDRLRVTYGGPTMSVTSSDRSFVVETPHRKILADRARLLGLVHELWGEAPFPRGRDPRYAVREAELVPYIAELAKLDVDEARAVYIHLHSAYETDFADDRGNPLAALFPKPVWAAKNLDVAGSGTALIRRALPHATTGALVDRIAAISAIAVALDSTDASDRGYEKVMGDLRAFLAAAAGEDSAVLREAAWLLDRELSVLAAIS